QGTSSSRSIVFDAHGRMLAMAQREFRQIYPQPGWVEHDPKEILESQLATPREALAQAGFTGDVRLMCHLTGARVHATDVSNGSRTLLLDVHTNTWCDELLAILDVPRA